MFSNEPQDENSERLWENSAMLILAKLHLKQITLFVNKAPFASSANVIKETFRMMVISG